MASGRRSTFFFLHLPMLVAAFVMVAVGVYASTAPALAQEQPRRSWSLRNLFSFPRKERRLAYPPAEPLGMESRPKKRSGNTARKPAEPAVPVVEKQPDAKTVLVVGDFTAGGVAEGLATVFAQNAGVRIIDRSSGSSGLVRDDYFNWPEQLKTFIETDKPSAVVVMLGSNDRQQMRVGETREQPFTEAWNTEYAKRAEALADIAVAGKVPLIWVGMPAFKPAKMTSDMLALNEAYRAAAKDVSGEFIDVWDGFVDENGAFITSGPDINGQPVRLRADDGINTTKAGKRKLAFYVEKPLNKILGVVSGAGAATVGLPQLGPGTVAPHDVDRTIPISLADPELDGGVELLGGKAGPKADARTAGEKLTLEGIAPDATPGRADDFVWPPKPPLAAATTDGRTSSIRN